MTETLMARRKRRKRPHEISLIGDVDAWEADAVKELLEAPEGSECVFYLDSAGGSVYGALAVVALMRLRRLKATVYVLSECSSAALLIFAACHKRFVNPTSSVEIVAPLRSSGFCTGESWATTSTQRTGRLETLE